MGPEAFEVLSTNHDPSNQRELLAEGAPSPRKLSPKIVKTFEAIKGSFVGQLPGVNHMSAQFTGTKQDSEALFTERLSSISMRTPGKALFGIKLHTEHGGKTVNGISGLSHVVNIVKQHSPVVDVRHRFEEGVASQHPFVEQLREKQHSNT